MPQRRTSPGRSVSTAGRGVVELRHDGPARDLRHRARRHRGVRQPRCVEPGRARHLVERGAPTAKSARRSDMTAADTRKLLPGSRSGSSSRRRRRARGPLASENSPTARAYRLEHQLACPVCEGQAVFDSNSPPQAAAIRDDIPKRIAAGQSDGEIRAAYVTLYNEKILETPSNSGLNIVVWAVPVLALILGVVGLGVAVRRWSRAPRLVATDEDEDIVRKARHLEGELVSDHWCAGRRPGTSRGRARTSCCAPSTISTPSSSPAHRSRTPTRVLHDDYTARASAVIQSLADGVDRPAPDGPRVPAVDAAAHDRRHRRLRGARRDPARAHDRAAQTPARRSPATPRPAALRPPRRRRARCRPRRPRPRPRPTAIPAQIAYARALKDVGAIPAAIQQFVVASKADPAQPEPLAYAGGLTMSIVPQVTDANDRKTLLAQGRPESRPGDRARPDIP